MADRSSPALRVLGPRAILLGTTDANRPDALNNVNTTTLPDGSLCWVTAEAALFEYHRSSAATAVTGFVVTPAQGGPGLTAATWGRWVRVAAGVGFAQARNTGGSAVMTVADPSAGLGLVVVGTPVGFTVAAAALTCTIPGLYRLSAIVSGESGVGNSTMRLKAGGTAVGNIASTTMLASPAQQCLACEALVQLAAADLVELIVGGAASITALTNQLGITAVRIA